MKQRKPSVLQDQRGFALVLFAIGFTALILSAVLAINYTGIGNYLGPQQQQADMQMVADAAARTAAIEAIKYQNAPDPETQSGRVQAAAEAVAAIKNYGNVAGGSVTAHIGSQITRGNYKNIPFAVEVIITKPWNFIYLPQYVAGMDVVLTARAVAAWFAAPAFVALNRTASNPTGITISGNSQISVYGGVYSNNPDLSSSIVTNGSGTELCAYAFASVGGFDTSGLCNSFSSSATPVTQTNQSPIADPYKSYDFTAPPPASPRITFPNPNKVNWDKITNFQPGHYGSEIRITFSTGRHTFAAGDYTFDGPISVTGGTAEFGAGNYTFNGSLSVNGTAVFDTGKYYFNGSLSSSGGTIDASAPEGVTFVFENGSGGFNMTSPMTFKINAPPNTATPYGGLAIVDRQITNQPQGLISDKITADINGIIYAPDAEITFNSTKSVSNSKLCLNIWALAIKIGGGASIGQTCLPSNVNASQFLPAGLVE